MVHADFFPFVVKDGKQLRICLAMTILDMQESVVGIYPQKLLPVACDTYTLLHIPLPRLLRSGLRFQVCIDANKIELFAFLGHYQADVALASCAFLHRILPPPVIMRRLTHECLCIWYMLGNKKILKRSVDTDVVVPVAAAAILGCCGIVDVTYQLIR